MNISAIANLSMSMAHVNVSEQFSIAMLKNSMDNAQNLNGQAIEMLTDMPAAADPNLGSNIDIRL